VGAGVLPRRPRVVFLYRLVDSGRRQHQVGRRPRDGANSSTPRTTAPIGVILGPIRGPRVGWRVCGRGGGRR
jgi:hypothetical protein